MLLLESDISLTLGMNNQKIHNNGGGEYSNNPDGDD